MNKILIITPTTNQVLGFRAKLIEKLLSEGKDVSVLTFDNDFQKEIEEKGIHFYSIKEKNRSLNIFNSLSLKQKLFKIIKKINPDVVFTFMIKPNTFGILASKKAKVKNIYSMVEGAGDVFIHNSLKWKIVRFIACKLYKKAFKYSKKVFFLNNDDKNEFISRKLVKESQCEVIHGIGVDLNHFKQKPMKNYNQFLMVARMLKTKGVLEYCKCARIVKQKYPDAVFNYLGEEGTVSLEDIKEYIEDGSINYLGTTDDVRPFYEDCSVNVLLSYREGFGLVNAEAGATGRPTITFDTIGTKDTVLNDYNGFLVEFKNLQSVVSKMQYLIENPKVVEEMGNNARKFAEENFDCNIINDYIISVMNQ